MKTISAPETYNLLVSNAAFVIDVRETGEYEQCHIDGTVLVPLSDLPRKIQEIDIPDNKAIIFSCLKGGRSAEAIQYLSENLLKDRELYNMEGGLVAWIKNDLPVVR
jgi:rhodanese-related sulfurtransferase